MAITVEATYENGVLKLASPLPLEEQQRVRVTVQAEPTGSNPNIPRDDLDRVQPAAAAPASSQDEPSDFAEYEMLDIVLNVPPSPDAITVIARRAEIWPSPYKIDESDLAPE